MLNSAQDAPYSSGITGTWEDMMPCSVFSASFWVAWSVLLTYCVRADWACGLLNRPKLFAAVLPRGALVALSIQL